MTPEQEQGEGGDDRRNLPALMIEEDVETEDVHDHRAEQRQAQRKVTANQENQPAGDLAESNHLHITRVHHRVDEVAGRSGHRRRVDEMQKGVRAKDDEHESEQDTSDDFGGFHAAMLNRMDAISTTFLTCKLPVIRLPGLIQ